MKTRKIRYGLALALLVPVAAAHAKSSHTLLYSFTGMSDGGNPFGNLIEDKAGNLYGTTVEGGVDNLGTVFKLAPDGTETVLWSFTGADGSYPEGGVIMDKKGNLYGTASDGGASNFGTVFEVAPNGARTVLHSFKGGRDGSGPGAALTMDTEGDLVGTTFEGGAAGDGIVFKVAPNGTETVLYTFSGVSDGSNPGDSLIMDKSGNFYGTTSEGGSTACGGGGCGEVFKLSPHGKSWIVTVLHAFDGNDGALPNDGVVMDQAGNLYGTTPASNARGNVFKITPKGKETVLLSFTGANGDTPYAGLIMDKAGNLYGTTMFGGANNYGTAFELAPDGSETLLYSFNSKVNGTDGFEPYGGLIEDKSGNLYGTTYGGGLGPQSNGTVFKITKH